MAGYAYRFFVDKKIIHHDDGTSEGGDHSRVIDVEATEMGMGEAKEAAQVLLDEDEVITSHSEINLAAEGEWGRNSMDYADNHFGGITAGSADLGDGHWVVRTGPESA